MPGVELGDGVEFVTLRHLLTMTSGIDLPLKALVWEDASAQVWLGYNDPAYLAQRHAAGDCPVVANLRKTLSGLAEAAVAK